MDLILEYTLSAAAVAKGFTAYLAALVGFSSASVRWDYGVIQIDPIALAAVLLLSLILVKGMVESSWFNIAVNVVNLLLIAFVLGAGFPHVNLDNYQPFAPYGWRGIFTGASVVFFSFIGQCERATFLLTSWLLPLCCLHIYCARLLVCQLVTI